MLLSALKIVAPSDFNPASVRRFAHSYSHGATSPRDTGLKIVPLLTILIRSSEHTDSDVAELAMIDFWSLPSGVTEDRIVRVRARKASAFR